MLQSQKWPTGIAVFTLLLGQLRVWATRVIAAQLCWLLVSGDLRHNEPATVSFLQDSAGTYRLTRSMMFVLQLSEPAIQPLDLFVPVAQYPLELISPGAVDAVQHVNYRVYCQTNCIFHHKNFFFAQMWMQSYGSDRIHIVLTFNILWSSDRSSNC